MCLPGLSPGRTCRHELWFESQRLKCQPCLPPPRYVYEAVLPWLAMAVSRDARQRQRKSEAPACFLARTAVHSSSVVQAVTGSFRRPGTEDVVLCKQTALELLCLTADGSLESVFEQSTFGSVVRLGVLPSDAASTVRICFHDNALSRSLLLLLSRTTKLET